MLCNSDRTKQAALDEIKHSLLTIYIRKSEHRYDICRAERSLPALFIPMDINIRHGGREPRVIAANGQHTISRPTVNTILSISSRVCLGKG